MANNQFKIRVGTEFDAAGLEAQINKHLKDHKITISFDADDSSVTKASKKMRENAKAVENEFKQALALQKQITAGQRQLSNKNLSKGIADNLRKGIAEARVELNKLYSDYGKKFSDSQRLALEKARGGTPGKQIGNTKDTYNQMLQSIRQIEKESKNMLSSSVDTKQFALAEQRLNELTAAYNEFRNSVNGQLNTSQLNKLDTAIKNATNNIETAKAKITDDITKQLDNGAFTRSFKSMESQINNLKGPNLLAGNLRNLKEAYQELNNIGPIVDDESFYRAKAAVDKYNSALTETQTKYKILKDAQDQQQRVINNDNALRKLDNDKKTFGLQIDNWLNNNSAAVAQFGDRLRDIKARIADVNNSADLGALRAEFTQTTLEAKNAGVAMMSFGDRLKRQAREYASYIGIAGVVAAGAQAVRAMAQNVLEVDTAMTGLYRVTDMTAEQYDKLYADMISASKEYGTTLTDTINATSDWVRAGFDADTALGLADVTAMYQHISDLDYDEASENLLTAYNGFKDSFNEEFGGDAVASVEHIADAFNELDNKFSITSAGLGEGLARSASALQLAGNTFEEAAA